MSQKKLVMLVIMDGYGIRENPDGNAIVAAKKPNLDKLFQKYPDRKSTRLNSSHPK